MAEATKYPEIVSQDKWLTARMTLLAEEKALTRQRDAVAARRRRLPMVRIEKDYAFEGPSGPLSLADLFGGHSQLFLGHFMFDPDWDEGCSSCTHLADEISDGHIRHLADSNTAFTYVSRAPIAKIEAYKAKRGWTFPWVSSFGSDFNYDFGVTLDPAKGATSYNYKTRDELAADGFTLTEGKPAETPGFSAFLKVGDDIFHTYSTFARGCEAFGGAHYILDMTVWGRQQSFEDSPEGWPQNPTYG
ncbi:DUF899 domain-containing protein [Aestuariibius sp. 2305UL40-4]|uniref:DUF899 domain-containing protein n=1 Tax=Aestuariibius violaceus TaxID=3234132 RepID=UPI00345E284D